ncbi:hypothetical protein [Pseudomonas paeninsulae]|uniref:hypothetical protein n=1 Tax=Pseudomonas paeninsulae TaxID=3110772 RepID=UPI002D76B1FC|nr:hypothetical protein [Pseudomonas sp. IT1137]
MAFNICSKAGWFRLWVFISVLLGVVALFHILAGNTYSGELQTRYDMEMSRLTPEQLARDRADRMSGLFAPAPSSTKTLEQLRAKATERYKLSIEELPSKQLWHVLRGIIAWAAASLGLLVIGWLIGWVLSGFISPKTSK